MTPRETLSDTRFFYAGIGTLDSQCLISTTFLTWCPYFSIACFTSAERFEGCKDLITTLYARCCFVGTCDRRHLPY